MCLHIFCRFTDKEIQESRSADWRVEVSTNCWLCFWYVNIGCSLNVGSRWLGNGQVLFACLWLRLAEMESRESCQYPAFLTEKSLVNKQIIIWKLFLFSFPVSKMTYPSCRGINCYPCLIDADVHYRFFFPPLSFHQITPTDSCILKIYIVFTPGYFLLYCVLLCGVVSCHILFCCI